MHVALLGKTQISPCCTIHIYTTRIRQSRRLFLTVSRLTKHYNVLVLYLQNICFSPMHRIHERLGKNCYQGKGVMTPVVAYHVALKTIATCIMGICLAYQVRLVYISCMYMIAIGM